MNEEQSKVLIQVMEGQRNAALTALAHTEAALLIANARIKALLKPPAAAPAAEEQLTQEVGG